MTTDIQTTSPRDRRAMMLAGKVVVITGVGQGMGCKLAMLAAAEGAKVAVSARSEGFIRDVAAEIENAGGQAISIATDVAQTDQCERLAAATREAFGRIDALINSAYRHKGFIRFEDGAIEEWQANMNVTHFGALRMVRAVLPQMKAQGGGAIVNISTKSSVQMVTGEGDYATAKAAMNAATRQLALELGRYGIRVNVARMGWLWGVPVQRALEARAAAHGMTMEAIVAEVAKQIPLGRIPTDEECARSVLFLASDYASAVSGAALDINGGQFMPL